MPRQSISLTEPNDEWLKSQVNNKEYSSKSELVNDLIRNERKKVEKTKWLEEQLEKGRNSGFSSLTVEQVFEKARKEAGVEI